MALTKPLKLAIKQLGFTLVEMVMVIIILGIVGVAVSSFITFSTHIYGDAVGATQVLSDSRFAMERMTREIRSAVPNSIRVKSFSDSQCVEFMPIVTASSYLSMPISPDSTSNTGTVFNTPIPIAVGNKIIIYPLTSNDVYADSDILGGKIFTVSQIVQSSVKKIKNSIQQPIELTFNQNARFAEASPSKRFYVIDNPISYCFVKSGSKTNLYRYQGYTAKLEQPSPKVMDETKTGVLMAEHITNNLSLNKPIHVEAATLVNNALVVLNPEFEAMGTKFTYQQQVQVINAP